MPVYKDVKRGTWYVSVYYEDWTGERKLKKKRGFKTKREAAEWERNFIEMKRNSLQMTFENLWLLYEEDMEMRLRESTMRNKLHMIEKKVLPYFAKKKMCDISPSDVRKWQNGLMKGGYSQTYLKTINNQLNAIMNYAVRYYGLGSNPCLKAGSMGKAKADEKPIWTQEEFEQFSQTLENNKMAYAAFNVLFWTGMREGELLALTGEDIHFDTGTISITKSYQRINGKDVVTPPKTPRSIREVTIPEFLAEILSGYIQCLFDYSAQDRLFSFTKYKLLYILKEGCRKSGVKHIRIHDIRHSHASLLIEHGTPILEVRDRLGHENIETTLGTYGHLYPNKQKDIANRLNELRKGNEIDRRE